MTSRWNSGKRGCITGRRYTAVGGSDNHFLKQQHVAQLAVPTLWVHCDGAPSAANSRTPFRAGHIIISNRSQQKRVDTHRRLVP